MSKTRLSATVDADLIQAAEQAVRRGPAATVSAWLNDAMRLKLEHDRRLEALSEFVAAYEAEHGEITRADMRAAERRARSRALPARGPAPRRAAGGRRA
jgi:hypothetical protein